jgi:hypothetical protein
MKYIQFGFMFLVLTTTLVAADAFVGTWKMNPAKSKFKTGAAPKEQTVKISEAGSNLDVAVQGTSADGKPIATHYTIPSGGGTGKIIESYYEAVSGKVISANVRESSFSKGGKVVYTTQAELSKDGKALLVHTKGTGPTGQMLDGTVAYEKQ